MLMYEAARDVPLADVPDVSGDPYLPSRHFVRYLWLSPLTTFLVHRTSHEGSRAT